jgi:hypothetical protein
MNSSSQVGRDVGRSYLARVVASAVIVTVVASGGCVGTFDVAGGPSNVRIKAKNDDALDTIRPLVAGDQRAMDEVASVAARERRGKILLYTTLALVGLCTLSNITYDPDAPREERDRNLYLGLAVCGAGVITSIATIIVTPKMSTYGGPLRTFNETHPQTPFIAPKLGVNPPAPPPATVVTAP